MKHKLIGERPPLPEQTRQQIHEVTEWLNQESIKDFTPHDALLLLVDRGWSALYPEKVSKVKRKKYERIPF
jgi:hypothetical protein